MADVFVLPSVKEGFGIVFIEAMYYQLPVIAGNTDGSVDALKNGSFGQLINPYSVEEITNSILHILDQKKVSVPSKESLHETFGFDTYKNHIKALLIP